MTVYDLVAWITNSYSKTNDFRGMNVQLPTIAAQSGWHLDFWTSILSALVTSVVLPTIAVLYGVLRRHFKDWVAFAGEFLMWKIGRWFKESLAVASMAKKYSRTHLGSDENRLLHVPSQLDTKLEIDKVFVPLTLEGPNTTQANYNHGNILSVGNRLRVIGDPGSGKSSLVKRLFRDECQQIIANRRGARLPVLLQLKALPSPGRTSNAKLGDWLLEKLKEVAKVDVFRMQDLFDVYSKGHGLLVLLDGLDEVASQNYPRIQDALDRLDATLAKLTPNNTIVLTMRTQFHQQVKEHFRASFGNAFLINPFSPTDIYDFLSRWPFKQRADKDIARIYKELTDHPTLREMCTNPLILSMYVAEDQASEHIVAPESRTEFYKKVTEELVFKRRLRQRGRTSVHAKLREQWQSILGQVAFNHILDPQQSINNLKWEDAIGTTKSVMKCTIEKAEECFLELQKETGLISDEQQGQSIRFIHLTFCEFFAAFEAIQGQKNGWSKVINAYRAFQIQKDVQLNSRFVEVIPFACGLISLANRADAIADVAALEDSALLTRCFLETKAYDHARWREFVENEKTSLLNTPEAEWDTAWLRRLHLFNVVMQDAAACAAHIPDSAASFDMDDFLHSLKKQQNESLAKLVSAYAEQDAAAAFRLAELSNLNLADAFPEIVIKYCDQTPFCDMVIDNALRDHEERVHSWAPLIAAAGLYSQLVAHKLGERPPAEEWKSALATIPSNQRWDEKRLFLPSFFTQCLAFAVQENKRWEDPLLKQFREIPSPRRFRFRLKRVICDGMLVMFLLVALLPTAVFFPYFRDLGTRFNFHGLVGGAFPIIVLLPMLVLEAIWLLFSFHVYAARQIYREVLYETDRTITKRFGIFPIRERRSFVGLGLLKMTSVGRILVENARTLNEYRAATRPRQ